MVAQLSRSRRFSPPVREQSFADLDGRKTKLLRTRASSPSSVRCFVEEEPKKSLVSSIKPVDSLPSRNASTSTRKVGFASWVGVKDTISVFDMTDDEIENYWLQEDEYMEIRRRNRALIRRAEKLHSLREPLPASESYEELGDDIEQKEDGNYLSFRGLESGTRSESMRKKTSRRNSIQRVLIEQEFQCLQGYHDDEAIADLYTEVTSPCKFRAVHLAMEDRIASQQ